MRYVLRYEHSFFAEYVCLISLKAHFEHTMANLFLLDSLYELLIFRLLYMLLPISKTVQIY